MSLPARGIRLPRETDELLRKLKVKTRVSPNVVSRIAFFKSVESGYRYHGEDLKLDGSLTLDKVTWLGELALAVEATLKLLYPELDDKQLLKAWASHVKDGAKAFRMAKSLTDFIN